VGPIAFRNTEGTNAAAAADLITTRFYADPPFGDGITPAGFIERDAMVAMLEQVLVACTEQHVPCAFFGRNLHLRMPLVPTPACFSEQACDQWHSSRVSTFLTGWHG
jgi:hypothetical protein